MIYYDSALVYIQSAATLQAKITAIDNIIDALIVASAQAATTGHIQEYHLNDGQTTIRTTYRDIAGIQKAILAFEQMRERYVNRLNGRVNRLVDSKNLPYGSI